MKNLIGGMVVLLALAAAGCTCSEPAQTAGPAPALPAVSVAIDPQNSDTYTAGRWRYEYTVNLKGSRSEGYYGVLLLDGQPVPEPGINDYYATPWGALYWVGQRPELFGDHGWVPQPVRWQPVGRELPTPR